MQQARNMNRKLLLFP